MSGIAGGLAARFARAAGLDEAPTTPVFTTSRRTECLVPARLDDDDTVHGFLLGRSLTSAKPYSYSLHELYRQDVVQSLNMVVFGDVGFAKTSLIKSYGLNMIDAGGRVAVFDRKIQTSKGVRGGEYLALADALGGAKLVFDQNPAAGCHISPLDPAFQATAGTSTVGPDKLLLLAAQVACGAGLDDTAGAFPQYALSRAHQAALRRAGRDGRAAVLEDVIEALYTPDGEAIPGPVDPATGQKVLAATGRVGLEDVFRWGLPVAIGLERYVTGDLAGLIDGPTRGPGGAPIDLRNRLVVFDTSALPEGSDEFGLMTMMAGALLQTDWAYQAGDKLIVREEAYSSDMLAQIGDLWRVFAKRGRGHGLATVDVFHHPAEALEGGQASAVAKEAAVTWIARQEHNADLDACQRLLGVPELALPGLSIQPVGTWLVKVSGRPWERVQHLRTARQILLTDSDMGVRGDVDGIEA